MEKWRDWDMVCIGVISVFGVGGVVETETKLPLTFGFGMVSVRSSIAGTAMSTRNSVYKRCERANSRDWD